MGFETQDVERKVMTILRVLNDSQEPLGARVIAQHLKDYGIEHGQKYWCQHWAVRLGPVRR